MDWSKFHDASLEGIELDWQAGTVTVEIRYFVSGVLWKGKIRGAGFSNFKCSREFPWGESRSINEVSMTHLDSSENLMIEVQSGDEIVIRAGSFCLSEEIPFESD